MPEPDTAPQPRTPSPSSVDWKAAEEETKRQFAAKAAGRKILTYEEWEQERRDKNEKWRQERKRKEWVEREVARRALQEERGDTREAVLRSATSSASRPLTDKEWEQMQEMAKHLPAASERPKKDGQQLGDKEAKKEKPVVRKEAKHSMPPPDLPAPLSPGYTGVWRGGCCPGFRFRGHPGGGVQYAQGHQRGPQGHQYGPQGFQYVPQGPQGGPQGGQPGFQGHHPGLQGQQGAPVSLGLGPVRYRSPQEIAEATAWLERHSGGPALDLRPPETVVMHEVAMARAKAQAVPPECQQQQREEPPARPQEGETLLQRILRLAREGSVALHRHRLQRRTRHRIKHRRSRREQRCRNLRQGLCQVHRNRRWWTCNCSMMKAPGCRMKAWHFARKQRRGQMKAGHFVQKHDLQFSTIHSMGRWQRVQAVMEVVVMMRIPCVAVEPMGQLRTLIMMMMRSRRPRARSSCTG